MFNVLNVWIKGWRGKEKDGETYFIYESRRDNVNKGQRRRGGVGFGWQDD